MLIKALDMKVYNIINILAEAIDLQLIVFIGYLMECCNHCKHMLFSHCPKFDPETVGMLQQS